MKKIIYVGQILFFLLISDHAVYASSILKSLQISIKQPAPAIINIVLSNNDSREKTLKFFPNSHVTVLKNKPATLPNSTYLACQFNTRDKNFIITGNNSCSIYVRANPSAVDAYATPSTLRAIVQSQQSKTKPTVIAFAMTTQSSLYLAQRDLPIVFKLTTPHTLSKIQNGPSQNYFMHVFALEFDHNGIMYIGGSEASGYGLAKLNLTTNIFNKISAHLPSDEPEGNIYSLVFNHDLTALYVSGMKTDYNPNSYHFGQIYSLNLTQNNSVLQPLGGVNPFNSNDDSNQTAVLNIALSPWSNELFSAGGMPQMIPNAENGSYHFINFVARYYPLSNKWHYTSGSRLIFHSPIIKLLFTNQNIYAISSNHIFLTRDKAVNPRWKMITLPDGKSWQKLGSGTILKNKKDMLFGGLTHNFKHLVYLKNNKLKFIATTGIPPQYYVNHMITDPVSGTVYFTTTSIRYASNRIWPGQLLEYKNGKTSILINNSDGGFAYSSLAIGTSFTHFSLISNLNNT